MLKCTGITTVYISPLTSIFIPGNSECERTQNFSQRILDYSISIQYLKQSQSLTSLNDNSVVSVVEMFSPLTLLSTRT
jgi:hypothetical protein